MKSTAIRKAASMAAEGEPVFLTTVGPGGMPHLTTVGAMTPSGEDRLRLTEWFCPQTVENVTANRRVSLVVWDPAANTGWQLTGQVDLVEESAILDGYDPRLPEPPMPQTLRTLELHVDSALRFRHGPHSDKEE